MSAANTYFIVKRSEEEDIISVRRTLVFGGYFGCVSACIFAIVIVAMAPPLLSEEAQYISEGMQAHCGWSVLMLGSCSFFIFICQLIAGVHMNRHSVILFSICQLAGWNVVMGIVDTGWNLHYMGLAVFLLGNLGYHWIASRDPHYGHPNYQLANWMTMFFTLTFGTAAFTHTVIFKDNRELKAVGVALEFVLLFSSMFENMLLVHGLDQYENIHLVFERKPPPVFFL